MKTFLIISTLSAWGPLAQAQAQPGDFPAVLAGNRFGRFVIGAYEGTLGWTLASGNSLYSATATLRDGVVHCVATSQSEAGHFSRSGEGLIEFELGLAPDAEHPPAQRGGKMYIIRAACPNPRGEPGDEARWSDEYSTNLQQGGDYDSRRTASDSIIVHKMPAQFKGGWEETVGEETRTMIWNLCLSRQATTVAQPARRPTGC